jgi:DNA-binding NarL/FixJ family response regulator
VNEPGPTAGVSPSRGPEARATAVIVAGNEETRVLLRGLVRLQHFHVVGESEGATEGLQLIRQHRPSLVLIDTSLVEGGPAALLQSASELLPECRLVVVGALDPHGAPAPQGPMITYLRKPFRIAEFAQAIGRNAPTKPTA